METYELRYFIAVAKHENIHRASEEIHVSPGSLSKAIGRLEAELGTSLFARERRGIKLTPAGSTLQLRAAEILRLEAAARAELGGIEATPHIVLSGSEALLAAVGPSLIRHIAALHNGATFTLRAAGDVEALRAVQKGEAHLGLITIPSPKGVASRPLFESVFQTVVGRGHPLYRTAKAGDSVPIAEVLKHPFCGTEQPMLGVMTPSQAPDGWRDDRFARDLRYITSSLQVLEELLVKGLALAYLPDFFAEQLPVIPLMITGCPYVCQKTARLVASSQIAGRWLKSWSGQL